VVRVDVLSRRVFTGAILVGSGPCLATTANDAKELYRDSIVFDGLANASTFNILWPPVGPLTAEQLTNIRASGITAINLTVTIGRSDFETVVGGLAFWNSEAERNSARLCIVRQHADITAAKKTGKLGLVFGFQRTTMLGDDASRIKLFRDLGVRIMQLTYNNRTLYGDGCLESSDAGLSVLGHQAVAEMNRVGVAVDLSHCGRRTTAEGIAASTKPILLSHVGCNAVHRHPRNKNDSELRAMAEKGGVAGIYLMPFLDVAGARNTDLVIRHIEHAIRVCGEDHVGIGSDLSIQPITETPEYKQAANDFVASRRRTGGGAPGEDLPLYIPDLNHPRRLESIAVALAERGHRASTITKIIGGNFHRVLGEIWAG
jgi:membrane dipeptidase